MQPQLLTADHVPDTLVCLPQWVCWRYQVRQGKRTKIPFQSLAPDTEARTNDPRTWSSFKQAVTAMANQSSRIVGIGFVFAKDDGLFGIDLDAAIDTATGEIEGWAQNILHALPPTYTEISPSGAGLKLWGRGDPPIPAGKTGRKKTGFGSDRAGAVEIYRHTRFFTVTGRKLPSSPNEVADCTATIAGVYSGLFPSKPEVRVPVRPGLPADTSDAELLRIMFDCPRNGSAIRDLFNGHTDAYDGDDSRADAALLNHLAFYTGGDREAMDRLFRQSGLYREKWERPDYRQRTLEFACAGTGETYSARRQRLGTGKVTTGPPSRNGTAPCAEDVSGHAILPDPDAVEFGAPDPHCSPSTEATPAESTSGKPPPIIAPALPFPLEALPTPLRRFVNEAAVAFPCQPDLVAVPMLTLIGAAIGNTRVIEVKPSWHESALLYTGVVAQTGACKTPVLSLVRQPLDERQAVHATEFREHYAAYERDLARYERDHAAWKAKSKTVSGAGDPIPEKPLEPFMPQLYTTDATLEALVQLLERNPRGTVLVKDELAGWLHAMDAYRNGRGGDRQAWLSFWSSTACLLNRKSAKAPVLLHRPFVAVCGCLPPDVLKDFADERGLEDGFIHRILFAYPDDLRRRWTDVNIESSTAEAYSQVFQRLWSLAPVKKQESAFQPLPLKMSADAREAFTEWYDIHYAEMDAPLFLPSLRGTWAKADGHCARLALIIQLSRWACGEADEHPVDAVSVRAAIRIIEYFKSHAVRVYGRFHATETDQQVARALAWIDRQPGKLTTARDINQYKVAGAVDAESAKRLLRELVKRGYGTVEVGNRGSLTFRRQ